MLSVFEMMVVFNFVDILLVDLKVCKGEIVFFNLEVLFLKVEVSFDIEDFLDLFIFFFFNFCLV